MAVRYLSKYGHRVLENGYEVVPITPGGKFPTIDKWQTLKITHKKIDGWKSNGHARDGIGIRTRFTPLLDIDSTWKPAIARIIKKAAKIIGQAPARVGNAPKVGLMYRSTAPFRKVQSKAYKDPNGNKAQVEFLGDGQQFVAYAIHPDTKRPYRWTDDGQNPREIQHDDLEEVSQDQALEIVNDFEEYCIAEGWERWKTKKQSTALTTRRNSDPDDIAGDVPCGLTIEEVKEWVARLDNGDDVEYEDSDFDSDTPNYLHTLFAIWHETNGSEEGRQIAWDWSEKSDKHEQEEGRFDKIWNSADPEERNGSAITFRYVIRLVVVQEDNRRKELRDSYLEALKDCDDADELKKICEKISKTRFDDIDIERMAGEIQKCFKRATSATMPIATARKLIYHRPIDSELPAWVKPWVYIMHTKRFFNRFNGMEIEPAAFEAAYSRYIGGQSAIDFALNKAQIKTFYMQMYKPDDEEEFWFAGNECVNTFSERLMPQMPGKYSKKDLRAISIIEQHIAHILPDEREAGIFVSYLSHVVKTRQRPNWMVLLQGVDGDGKSIFGNMMGAVLGSKNVRVLDAPQLEDKYTDWAVGQLFTFVEELRLQGHNRFDVLNKIKPFITNEVINVHPKNVNPYTALNTTAYMAATNFRDALPLNDNDRRYLVLMSAWQTGEQIRKFLDANPGYFDRLFGALNRAGALRQWLVEYEPHEEFNPKTRAPLTAARNKMIELSKNPAQIAFEDILKDDDNPYVSKDLVVVSELNKALYEAIEETIPQQAVSRFLSSFGYDTLNHRVRLPTDPDYKHRIWVRSKKQFDEKDMGTQRRSVIKFIHRRSLKISHKDAI